MPINGVHGCPDLMAHLGEEVTLTPICSLSRFLQVPNTFLGALALGDISSISINDLLIY